ncbi:MAG: hypothetical protein LBV04_04535 [Deferribacteraceae bacterium]|jgi:triacylglycerol esterase/lipase EstA (alpha/beta hydrolase family)|nr:hypothetical protein [Deferribacteraceae bacterium]
MKRLIILIFFVLLAVFMLNSHLHHDYEVTELSQDATQDYVVLIHGIYASSAMLEPIADALVADYNVINIQYPSADDSIEQITEQYIKPVIASLDGKKIHFVAHSMGTIVLRYYLKNNSIQQLGKVIFISPPSHGSNLSDFWLARLMKNTFGEAVAQLSPKEDSFVNALGEPDYPCQVLMGNRSRNPMFSAIIDGKDDGMVPVESARLATCGWELIDKASHKSILKDERTIEAVIGFIASNDYQN